MTIEIKVGEGYDTNEYCSATGIQNTKYLGGISENEKEYWVNETLFKVRLRISKDSKEGKALKVLIDSNAMRTDYINLFTTIVLEHFVDKPSKFRKLLGEVKEESYEDGRASYKKDIKNLLGW